jgi:anaerobic ribonucleoside-triphosphate reductase activating protein
LWERRPECEISIDGLYAAILGIASKHKVDGFTVSGGEPMDQPEDLNALIIRLAAISKDILVYSGYKYVELRERGSEHIQNILSAIAVLIDGQYVEELNRDVKLRGSENQEIIIMNGDFNKKYENHLKTARNRIQNFMTADGVVSVGIHRKEFRSKIASRIHKRGDENG